MEEAVGHGLHRRIWHRSLLIVTGLCLYAQSVAQGVNHDSCKAVRASSKNVRCIDSSWVCPTGAEVVLSLVFEMSFESDSVIVTMGDSIVQSFVANNDRLGGHAGTYRVLRKHVHDVLRISINGKCYQIDMPKGSCYAYIRKQGTRLRVRATKCLWKIHG
jgi:hypothetical protein